MWAHLTATIASEGAHGYGRMSRSVTPASGRGGFVLRLETPLSVWGPASFGRYRFRVRAHRALLRPRSFGVPGSHPSTIVFVVVVVVGWGVVLVLLLTRCRSLVRLVVAGLRL